ncbi:hypothetical protein CHS0354_011060 [Potamilus streckersoni]|uniref:Thyroglobulin type-1 domain-containing protein n=1 Tax=Potamilus streckersoni TaxID=2493646 RepID=A0AAE0TL62_9BIVA|nr:hypothetical protein CHS0354_011060 [Potamilus streckersoni]
MPARKRSIHCHETDPVEKKQRLRTAILAYANSVRCPQIFCEKFRCTDVSACDGVIKRGFCGCCEICETELGPCAKERNDFKARLQHNQIKGMPPVGLSLPVCTPDGYYAAKQCRGSQCFCVDKNGGRAQRYSANIWEVEGMNCECARDEFEYQESGLLGKVFNCASNGNYEPIQCTGSQCYCVDQNGSQIGTTTVNVAMIDSLNC